VADPQAGRLRRQSATSAVGDRYSEDSRIGDPLHKASALDPEGLATGAAGSAELPLAQRPRCRAHGPVESSGEASAQLFLR